jgi:uncharacterized membrane protein
MSAGHGRVAAGTCILLLGAAAVLFFHVTQISAPGWLLKSVTCAQVAVIVGLCRPRLNVRYRLAVICVTIAAAMVFFHGFSTSATVLAAAGGCHTIAYISLLLWFSVSLRSGREPVITGFARRVRHEMPNAVMRYTRWATIAWCGFFTAQLTVSAALLFLASTSVWSMFVSVFNLPLIVAMVLGEFAVRTVRFRHEPCTSLSDTLLAWRHARIPPAGRS